jgi:tetratricopeptide (TPR) repeat protein
MKFKTIFIIFNVIIVISFLFFFTMPFFIYGIDQFFISLSKTWIALAIFIGILGLFNAYFVINWNFFHLLEKEDWYGLIKHMEHRIYTKRSINRYNVKFLINFYICTSNIEGIKKLKDFLKFHKPTLIGYFAIQFGIPYLLAQKFDESKLFFEKLLSQPNIRGRDWIRWNYAISLMQLNEHENAKSEFLSLLSFKNDHIVYLLSLYMLNSLKEADGSIKKIIEKGTIDFKHHYSKDNWTKRVESNKSNIEVVSIRSIIHEASDWIFSGKNSTGMKPSIN